MRQTPVLMAVAILLGGCGSDDSSTGLSESIVGTWLSEGGKYITFLADGDYEVGNGVGVADVEFGTWSVDGDVLTKVTDPESTYCAGSVGIYESEIIDDGERLESTVVDDDCTARVRDFVSLTRHADQ